MKCMERTMEFTSQLCDSSHQNLFNKVPKSYVF